MNQIAPKRRLKAPSAPKETPTAWEGDLFARRGLPDLWDSLLERMGNGVVVIDAPWGEGKTWLAKNWQKHLTDSRLWRAIYIDAFANDYLEDPFLLITAEINKALSKDKVLSKKIVDTAARVAKATIPFMTSLLVDIVGRIALGKSDLSGDMKEAVEAAKDKLSDNVEGFLADKLKNYEAEQDAVKSFHAALSEFTSKQTSPVIIFIDELDRCKPTFAVKLLERVKHFFDVPNLVFILMLNRDQLEKSIKGVYGSDVDAAAYLHKFVDLSLPLPKKLNVAAGEYYATKYAHRLLEVFGMKCDAQETAALNSSIQMWTKLFDLSFRDIERIFTLLAVTGNLGMHALLRIYLAVLKIKYPQIFEGLSANKTSAHRHAQETVKKAADSHHSDEFDVNLFNAITSFHGSAQKGFKTLDAGVKEQVKILFPPGTSLGAKDMFHRICSDLNNQGGLDLQ